MQAEKTVKVRTKKDKSYRKLTIDFDQPVTNSLLSLETAKKFLEQNIKVNGLKGKLGESVKVSTTEKSAKQKNNVLVQVDNAMKFSKRYIKYLVKKFLKRENINLYLRVISSGPGSYLVKIFQRNTE
ncbi:60S ribosomal protein L22 [archaeon]|nr:60S ribosomal protein L22 [archaeon]